MSERDLREKSSDDDLRVAFQLRQEIATIDKPEEVLDAVSNYGNYANSRDALNELRDNTTTTSFVIGNYLVPYCFIEDIENSEWL